jgi:predicted ATPase
MGNVEAVAQRNASGAELLSATAREMASRTSALRELVSSVQLDEAVVIPGERTVGRVAAETV